LNTVKLHIKNLASKTICDGHLFLQINETRRFYLMKPGVLVDPAFVRKHAPLGTEFDFHQVIDGPSKQIFNQLFKELRYSLFEKDLKVKAIEIVDEFQRQFSKGEHFLTFALACFEEFCQIPHQDLVRMHETDMHLFRKSMYSAAFAVIIALSNDYYRPIILQDFYTLAFTLDIGLCDANYSYYVASACNLENQSPGSAHKWMMDEKASANEVNLFLKHPTSSYEYLQNNIDILAYPELAEVVLYQHELANGEGFPRGVHKGLISGYESLVLLADALVEIKDSYEFELDVQNYILNFKNKKLTDLPVSKVYTKFCKVLLYFSDKRNQVSR